MNRLKTLVPGRRYPLRLLQKVGSALRGCIGKLISQKGYWGDEVLIEGTVESAISLGKIEIQKG